MNKFLASLMIFLSIFFGGSLLLFVMRLIWRTPNTDGMMMGVTNMYHHMGLWMMGTVFLLLIFIVFAIILFFMIFNNKNK